MHMLEGVNHCTCSVLHDDNHIEAYCTLLMWSTCCYIAYLICDQAVGQPHRFGAGFHTNNIQCTQSILLQAVDSPFRVPDTAHLPQPRSVSLSKLTTLPAPSIRTGAFLSSDRLHHLHRHSLIPTVSTSSWGTEWLTLLEQTSSFHSPLHRAHCNW